jgi:hypothetical protein
MPSAHMLLGLALLAVVAPAPQKSAIAWSPRWDDAFAEAAQHKKVVFLALNMDGEAANDRMATKVYTDPKIVAASKLTVNLPASRFEHAADGKPCARFGGVTCTEHRRIEGAARDNVLKADAAGYTVAPQHIFLSGDGKVLLSVPYEVSVQELEWCFHEALAAVDAEAAKKIAVSGRAPRRLVQGGVFDPSAIPGANLAPPTREEVLAIVKELRASLWSANRLQNIQRLLLSAEPEAIEQIEGELKNEMFGRRGWIQGGPGGAGGPDAAQFNDYKDRLMHGIGVLSPQAYWKLVAEYLEHAEEELRHEAIVALEQLAAPESVGAITKAIAKEKVPALRKDLYRALGSAGAADEKARKTLLKALASEKDDLARRNALFALGWFAPAPDSDKALSDALTGGTAEERSAAGLAAALSRHASWIERVKQAEGAEENPEVKACLAAALGVLQGAGLTTLRPLVRQVCGDEIEREKLFGVAQG